MPSGTGGQLSLRCPSGAWDVALGRGQTGGDLEPSALHPGYCLTRPLLAIAVGIMVDEGHLSFDEPIGHVELLDGVHVELTCSIEDVLSHRAGLTGPSAFEWRALDVEDLRAEVGTTTCTARPTYSEVISGLIVEAIIRRHRRIEPGAWLAAAVLEPLSLVGEICVDPRQAIEARDAGRLQVPVGGDRSSHYPLLSELIGEHLQRTRVAFGAWVSARGLAELYWRWVTSLEAAHLVPGLPSPETSRRLLEPRPGFFEPAQGHQVQYSAGGLVVDLDTAGICTTAGPSAFGHPGGFSTSFALADHDPPVAIAAYLNGIAPAFEDLRAVRTSLASACLDLAM